MPPRHPIPTHWLMTDERIADVPAVVARMPRGSGVVFRNHATPDRTALFARVLRIARRRRMLVLAAGGLRGGDGGHNMRHRRGFASRSVHSRRELVAAARAGVDLVFVSPIHPTRSHPGAQGLGRIGLRRLIAGAPMPVIALGGMNARRFRALRGLGVHGWAGIDAWDPSAA